MTRSPSPDHGAGGRSVLSVLWSAITWGLTACVVVIAAALVAVRLMGWSLFAIETGSMAPAYPAGTLIIVAPYGSFDEIQEGDVITYVMNEAGTTITHRVISIDEEAGTVTTKGDANDIVDSIPVLYENVVGRIVIGIPLAGNIVSALGEDAARPLVIAAIVILLFWGIAWDPIRGAAGRLARRYKVDGPEGQAIQQQEGSAQQKGE